MVKLESEPNLSLTSKFDKTQIQKGAKPWQM